MKRRSNRWKKYGIESNSKLLKLEFNDDQIAADGRGRGRGNGSHSAADGGEEETGDRLEGTEKSHSPVEASPSADGEEEEEEDEQDAYSSSVASVVLNQPQHMERSSSSSGGGQQRRNCGDPMQQMFGSRNFEPRETRMFNSMLLQEVAAHPALYDFTNEEYKSNEARNRHWDEVATRVAQPIEFVRTRWKTLRDRFKKEVNRLQSNQPGVPWQHYEEMLFLLPFVRDKMDESQFYDPMMCARGRPSASSAAFLSARASGHAQGAASHNESQLNSCTAAILDMAMSAVNKFAYSPAATNEMPSPDSATTTSSMFGTNSAAAADSFATGSSGATAIVTAIGAGGSSRRRPNNNQQLSNGTAGGQQQMHSRNGAGEMNNRQQQNNSIHGNRGGGGGKAAVENNRGFIDLDEEDELFCRIVMKKLGRLEERVKEKAKARIMDLLVEIQYGAGGRASDSSKAECQS